MGLVQQDEESKMMIPLGKILTQRGERTFAAEDDIDMQFGISSDTSPITTATANSTWRCGETQTGLGISGTVQIRVNRGLCNGVYREIFPFLLFIGDKN